MGFDVRVAECCSRCCFRCSRGSCCACPCSSCYTCLLWRFCTATSECETDDFAGVVTVLREARSAHVIKLALIKVMPLPTLNMKGLFSSSVTRLCLSFRATLHAALAMFSQLHCSERRLLVGTSSLLGRLGFFPRHCLDALPALLEFQGITRHILV